MAFRLKGKPIKQPPIVVKEGYPTLVAMVSDPRNEGQRLLVGPFTEDQAEEFILSQAMLDGSMEATTVVLLSPVEYRSYCNGDLS